MKTTISAYRLISEYKHHNPNGHFFDPETLKFFGERISEMRVLKGTVTVKDYNGIDHECYILSRLQRKAPGGPTRRYTYFDIETFEDLIVQD